MENGPLTTWRLREKMLGNMKARYDSDAKTMNDPTKAEKAVLEPM
jgi:hypothetical protein